MPTRREVLKTGAKVAAVAVVGGGGAALQKGKKGKETPKKK